MRKFASVATATVLGLAMLTSGNPASASVTSLTGGGSSFAGGILSVCKDSFATASATVNTQSLSVTYNTTGGSGTGRSSFQQGTYDFGGSDAPYAASETKPTDLVYVPLVGGPIAVVFKNPDITGNNLNLNATIISKIFKGTITYWDDAAIEAINPSLVLGHHQILPYYRSGSSGTSQNFVNWIKGSVSSAVSAGWTSDGTWATAIENSSPIGSTASGSSAMATAVDSNNYAIGYVDLKDAIGHTVQYAKVANGKGQYVIPTVAAAAKFLGRQTTSASGLVSFKYKTGAKSGEYNLSLITYGLGHKNKANYSSTPADALKISKGVKDFFKYSLGTCAASEASGLKYVALTSGLKTKALAQIALIGKN